MTAPSIWRTSARIWSCTGIRTEPGKKPSFGEYTRLTGWADDGSLARYGAYTWLKIAKQLALRSGPFRSRNEDSGWEVGDAVARGVACLAR